MAFNFVGVCGLVILFSDLCSPGLRGSELGLNTKKSDSRTTPANNITATENTSELGLNANKSDGLTTPANNITTTENTLVSEVSALPASTDGLPIYITPPDVDFLPTEVYFAREVTLKLEEFPTAMVVNLNALPPFRGGSDIFLGMTEWNNLVCGDSVCNKTLDNQICGNLRCDKCHCDVDCFRYGDCCPDTYLTSPPQQPQATFSCISKVFIGKRKYEFQRYKLVSSCPEQKSPTADQVTTADQCRKPNATRIQDNIPVYSSRTKLHYRNADCAKCNGVSNTVHWDVDIFCEKYVDLSWVSSPDDLLSLIRQEDTCAVHFQPPKYSDPRECHFIGDTVGTCNATGNWKDYDPDMERACSLYSQPVSYLSLLYENIFCLYCNGYRLSKYPNCYNEIVVPGVAPFSVLLDFRATMSDGVEQKVTSCPYTHVYDTKAKMCRALFCPVGKIVKNHTCTSIFKSARGLGYILHVNLTPSDREYVLTSTLDELSYQLFRYMNNRIFGSLLAVMDVDFKFMTVNGSKELHIRELDVQFSVVVGALIPQEEVERRLRVDLVRNKFWWYESAAGFPVYFDVSWRANVSNDRLVLHAFRPRTIDIEPIGVLRSENIQLHEERWGEDIPAAFRSDVLSYILVNDLLMCNMIELNMSEYTLVNSSHIFINSTGELLDEERYVWNGDSVRVCTNFTGDIPQRKTEANNTLYDQTELILTFVCTCLSLCGLAVTIVIYLAVPSIRQQLPGKNNLCLFVNLFLAQLLFLTGSTAKVSRPGCRALGIIIHYFWLATFCWKVVCAYHMYRLFTSPLKVLDQTKSLYRYLLFSHLFPTLWIVGLVSINLGLSDLVSIGYADRQNLCFLTSSLDVALGFAVPVALVVVINVSFFSRVVYVLHHRPKIERHVTKADVKAAVVYLKMSIILGFTWILGFVAVATNERGMWYVFTVINASNGVFVFILFGLKNISPGILTSGRFPENSMTKMSDSKTCTTSSSFVSRQHPNGQSKPADEARPSPSKPQSE